MVTGMVRVRVSIKVLVRDRVRVRVRVNVRVRVRVGVRVRVRFRGKGRGRGRVIISWEGPGLMPGLGTHHGLAGGVQIGSGVRKGPGPSSCGEATIA